jgi:hypothetical protein
MRLRSGFVVLGGLALLAPEISAQQAPAPRYYRVVEWESPPGEMGAFRTGRFGGLSKLYKDAKATTGFVIYTTENRTAIARQVDPKDLFSNPNAAIQAANPDAYRAWQAGLGGNSVVTRNEIWVEIPAHTYEPANAPQATGVSSASVRVAAGKGAAFDSARRDFVKFRQKIGFPYPVRAYRVVIGEVRNVYVTHFDSREKFFGANTLATLVEKAGAGAEWQALGARLAGSMGMDWSSTLWNYNAGISYVP